MSGYGERRSFITHGQYASGGIESEALGLPFKSTTCEDWYGFGDSRCPSRYIETGDLETDIISLKKWIGYYSLRGGSAYNLTSDLDRKQAEVAEIKRQKAWLQLTEEQRQRQQRLVNIDKIIVTLESELSGLEKTLSGYGAQHYIRGSIIADINKLTEELEQKKTRN